MASAPGSRCRRSSSSAGLLHRDPSAPRYRHSESGARASRTSGSAAQERIGHLWLPWPACTLAEGLSARLWAVGRYQRCPALRGPSVVFAGIAAYAFCIPLPSASVAHENFANFVSVVFECCPFWLVLAVDHLAQLEVPPGKDDHATNCGRKDHGVFIPQARSQSVWS